ncbi:thioesterase II family protein [Kitasatospora sp. NPDC059673]|uniref:thioesterase II family protein n=1 Tax=Kitasatospora sp. NPDC059673 TaxID=3346901 RepID=UPI0036A66E9D
MRPTIRIDDWLRLQKKSDDPAATVFVFHHAGGSSAPYRPITDRLPAEWDVVFVDLPGRGHNGRAKPLTRMAEVVAQLVPRVVSVTDGPRVFFGHSMGAAIAHGVAAGTPAGQRPVWLGLSGAGPRRASAAPDRPASPHLDRGRIIGLLRQLGGTPEAVFENRELLEYAVTLLHADLLTLADCTAPAAQLASPISVFGGAEDATAPVAELRGWEAFTDAALRLHRWPGGHFYLFDHPAALAARMAEDIADALNGRSGPAPEQVASTRV